MKAIKLLIPLILSLGIGAQEIENIKLSQIKSITTIDGETFSIEKNLHFNDLTNPGNKELRSLNFLEFSGNRIIYPEEINSIHLFNMPDKSTAEFKENMGIDGGG